MQYISSSWSLIRGQVGGGYREDLENIDSCSRERYIMQPLCWMMNPTSLLRDL
jgi:hypothetical protein